MKKFLVTILLINLLAAVGLVGFVLATGRLDGAKAKAILAMLRHPGSPPELVSHVQDLLEPPPATAATAPATAPAATMAHPPGTTVGAAFASASDRLEYARQAIEQERLRLDREAQDLRQRQKLLETQSHEVESRLTQISDAQKKFAADIQAQQARVKTEAFTRSLAMYGDLKPKQVKDLFIALQPDVVADYLLAMEPEQATRIISEFKTPEERLFIGGILEKIRAAGTLPARDPAAGPATMPGAHS